MKHINSLFACLAICMTVFTAGTVMAASDQYKEEAVQQAHQPEVAPIQEAAKVVAPLAEAPALAVSPAQPEAAPPASAQQRRRMDPPVLMMIIGGGAWLLGIILIVVGVGSLTTTGFGLAGIGYLLAVLGGLAATGGLIWFLVTR